MFILKEIKSLYKFWYERIIDFWNVIYVFFLGI